MFKLSQDSGTLVRSGVPQIIAASLNQAPVSVVWSGATMQLTWSAPLTPPETFTLRQGTPQVRTPNGGYLIAGSQTFDNPTPAPAGTVFSPYCAGSDLRGAVADGAGGTTDQLISSNSPGCGFTPAPLPIAWSLFPVSSGPQSIGVFYEQGRGGLTAGTSPDLYQNGALCTFFTDAFFSILYLAPAVIVTGDLWFLDASVSTRTFADGGAFKDLSFTSI